MHLTLTQAVEIDTWLRLPFDIRKQKCPFHNVPAAGRYRECYAVCATAFPKIGILTKIGAGGAFINSMLIKDCPCSKHKPKYVTERVKLKLKS